MPIHISTQINVSPSILVLFKVHAADVHPFLYHGALNSLQMLMNFRYTFAVYSPQ